MSDKMNDKIIRLQEGTIKKGGRNPQPSTPRPAKPPKAQAPKNQEKK